MAMRSPSVWAQPVTVARLAVRSLRSQTLMRSDAVSFVFGSGTGTPLTERKAGPGALIALFSSTASR